MEGLPREVRQVAWKVQILLGGLSDVDMSEDASAGGLGRKESGVIGVSGHHSNAMQVLSGSEK